MKKRMITILLMLIMGLGLLSVNAGAADSGSLTMPKLSKAEIKQLMRDNSQEITGDIFEVSPSYSAPYATGKVKTSALQLATDKLNLLRRLAGLPAVTLDVALCENAQYGAVTLAATGFLSHYPEQPAGMENSFYQQGYAATSSSNLYQGGGLGSAAYAFMDDSDSSNIDRLGHRRWQLNPTMGKVGFGCASAFVVEKVFDRSGADCDYDFISWPASGYFPSDLYRFSTYTAWSVTLNPKKYQTKNHQLDDVVVTLTRQSDQKSWTFTNKDAYKAGNTEYFNVDYGGYGVSNCIVFRPDLEDGRYEGVYTVQISGIKDSNGRDAEFSYQVEFFSAGGANVGDMDLTWSQEDGVWYYYRYGTPVKGWQNIDGSWYYFNALGEMQTGWMKNDGMWYYLDSSGAMQTGWVNDGGTWYYMSAGGVMQTGWLYDGGWYYLGGSGAMQTGWVSVDGTWYYMNGSGIMQTGWLNDGGTWYYLQSSGAMAIGWLYDGGWYYLSGSGAMQTGWVSVDGTWYYMNGSGIMQTGWLDDGGTWYYLQSSGAWAG